MTSLLNQKTSIGDVITYICITFATYASLNENLNSIALFIAIPIAFCCCFLGYNTISNSKSIRVLLALYIWMCVSYVFAINIEAANAEIQKLVGCFILSYTMASLAQKKDLIPWLYIIYCLLLIFAWKYANENIINEIIFGEERLNDDTLNANHFAYYTFYATFCVYIIGDIVSSKWLKLVLNILFLGTIILSFYTAIFTASRQILIIQIPFFILLLLCRYIVNNKKNRNLKLIIILLFSIAIAYTYGQYGQSVYENSLLKSRTSSTDETDDRVIIAKEALILFEDHPIVGHGPGNARYVISRKVFTHNTFLELLVNGGIPALLIFSYLIIYYLKTQYRRWRITKNNQFLTFIIFGIFWFIYQFLYVFYVDIWLISFFILVTTHSNTFYNTLITTRHHITSKE